jgi:hypothetical protein
MNRRQSAHQTSLTADSVETADILAEIHALRAQHAAEHGNDPEVITQDLVASFLRDHPDIQWANICPAQRRPRS